MFVAMDAVAGARQTPGRQKTGGAPPKPPHSFSLFPSKFWDFHSLYRSVAASLKPSVAAAEKSLYDSDGFCPIGARCLLYVAAGQLLRQQQSLSVTVAAFLGPTVAAAANLWRHSVVAIAAQTTGSQSLWAHTSQFFFKFFFVFQGFARGAERRWDFLQIQLRQESATYTFDSHSRC